MSADSSYRLHVLTGGKTFLTDPDGLDVTCQDQHLFLLLCLHTRSDSGQSVPVQEAADSVAGGITRNDATWVYGAKTRLGAFNTSLSRFKPPASELILRTRGAVCLMSDRLTSDVNDLLLLKSDLANRDEILRRDAALRSLRLYRGSPEMCTYSQGDLQWTNDSPKRKQEWLASLAERCWIVYSTALHILLDSVKISAPDLTKPLNDALRYKQALSSTTIKKIESSLDIGSSGYQSLIRQSATFSIPSIASARVFIAESRFDKAFQSLEFATGELADALRAGQRKIWFLHGYSLYLQCDYDALEDYVQSFPEYFSDPVLDCLSLMRLSQIELHKSHSGQFRTVLRDRTISADLFAYFQLQAGWDAYRASKLKKAIFYVTRALEFFEREDYPMEWLEARDLVIRCRRAQVHGASEQEKSIAYRECLKIAERSYRVAAEISGLPKRILGQVAWDYGVCLSLNSLYDLALSAFEVSLALRRESLPTDGNEIAKSTYKIAELLHDQAECFAKQTRFPGGIAEVINLADDFAKESLVLLTREDGSVLGPGAFAEITLGEICARRSDIPSALNHWKAAIRIVSREYSETHLNYQHVVSRCRELELRVNTMG